MADALAVAFGLALGVGDGDTRGEGAGIVGSGVKVGIGDCAVAFAAGGSTGALINAGRATRIIAETVSAVVRASIPEYTRCTLRQSGRMNSAFISP